jgi:hypothetical protein
VGLFTAAKTPAKHMTLEEVDFESDSDIIDFVGSRWESRDTHRALLEKQWYINVAHYLGYQYYQYDNYTGSMVLPPAPSWRVRLVCNRLMPIVRKVVSKILRARPTWTCIPATQDLEDQMVSIVGTKLLAYYWRYCQVDSLLVDAATWLSCTGNVFLRVVWDPAKGPEMKFAGEELSGLPPQFQQIAERGINLGDLDFSLVTPFELDPDPEATRFEEATHIVHTKARSPDYLQAQYGDAALDIEPDVGDEASLSRYYERRISGLVGPTGGMGIRGDAADQNSRVLTHQLWVNPTKKYPKGWLCVVAGGRLLQRGPLPPGMDDGIPYVHLKEIMVPGRFWGTCALEQCLGLQAEYNRTRSQVTENKNMMARPKWLVPKGSGVIETALTSEPGEVIFYNAATPKPEAWTPPPLPEYVIRHMEYCLKDLEDVSAIHEVTQARAPSGVRSGVAIAQLQEQDDQMLAPTFLTFEKGLGKIGAIALKVLANNVNEQRLIKLVGKDRQIETMVFSGRDLLGKKMGEPGVNYFDVECQMGSQLPQSRSAREAFVMGLVQNGILDRLQDRKLIFKILELGSEEPVLTDEQLDRQAARRENLQLAQGIQVEPMPWDNDSVHIEEHTRFEKQPEFLKNMMPQSVGVIEAHKSWHQMRIQQASMPQQPMQVAPPQMPQQGPLPGPPPGLAPEPPQPPMEPQPGEFLGD